MNTTFKKLIIIIVSTILLLLSGYNFHIYSETFHENQNKISKLNEKKVKTSNFLSQLSDNYNNDIKYQKLTNTLLQGESKIAFINDNIQNTVKNYNSNNHPISIEEINFLDEVEIDNDLFYIPVEMKLNTTESNIRNILDWIHNSGYIKTEKPFIGIENMSVQYSKGNLHTMNLILHFYGFTK